MIRGLDTNVKKNRRKMFAAIAKLAFEKDRLTADDVEALPYKLCDMDSSEDWGSVYRERAVIRERTRLALGMKLRPENQPVHVSQGIESSDIDEMYYEPPLMQVIPSACNACPENLYVVTEQCMGCVAHPCMEVCPRGAISMVDGKSHIDRDKCIKCGKCHDACPYDAITHKRRPCADACGVGAIKSDERGRADIDRTLCVSCGQCMVNCPFGAIADKSQIYQLIKAIRAGKKVIAEIAPAFVGQFGKAEPEQVKAAIKSLGFYEVYETALGADIGCVAEAKHYASEVATGELPFLLTSCCPSWSFLARLVFPETIENISRTMTPMVATARVIKKEHPDAQVVFIGPCASKKLEAKKRTVRSDVDFVITFEELMGIFEAKGIEIEGYDETETIEDATGAGRGYGVAGGVAGAIEGYIKEHYPDIPVNIVHAEGLAECKKMLALAKAGRMNGCLIEGMACPGGCVAGAGTLAAIDKGSRKVAEFKAKAKEALPDENIMDQMDEEMLKLR